MSPPAETGTSHAEPMSAPALSVRAGRCMRDVQRNRYGAGTRSSIDGEKTIEDFNTEWIESSPSTRKLAVKSLSLSPPM
eukprot:6199764-Pleurochrysis_carterae.AAC.1